MAKTMERRIDGIGVVELKGKIDSATAAATAQLLLDGSIGVRQLVLDLSAVSYVNGAGLRVILEAWQRQQSFGGQLILCAVPSYIREVLDIAGLTSLFSVCGTRAEALCAVDAMR